ncbi:L-arabinose transport system permease protein AraQ [Anaerocolumna cellulosilytica]|uniref:L-arabinose transport system permease protein AraQ n=1 Tax=Anaerocolumna cellulosilytica TaxID=433286 RepID=A0A6S6QP42_9FIRM|nr:carbohydrate ABC transporter permease [Anaerocolumna cellulosilytica]MBB5197991.1 arabinosaccharide transport system permease protein [Anaerocolumna cellulosilytica]BCJ93123.1 L-arabinose transport system permease protein AraQ [Anaerocolumna cellulosilytica]
MKRLTDADSSKEKKDKKLEEEVYKGKDSKKRIYRMSEKRKISSITATVFFTFLGILVIFPFAAAVLASFRPGQELIRYGLSVKLDRAGMTLNNYRYLFSGKHNYFLWFKNSLVLTILSVSLTLIICYFVAYGLAMYQYKLKNLLLFLVIATMMVPFEILMLPLYQEMIDLRLINTTAGVVLPGLCGASTIFFFRQFMIGLPVELLDAGRIDGATEYGICLRIMLPITKPAFAAMAILTGMGAWNSMLWPLLVYREARKFTLPIGLNTLLTPYGNNYDLLITGSCFAVLPILVLFLCFQSYFIDGMTAGAVKG